MKKGFFTSEFWMSAAAGALPFLLDVVPPTVKLVIATVAGGVYTISRTVVKVAELLKKPQT